MSRCVSFLSSFLPSRVFFFKHYLSLSFLCFAQLSVGLRFSVQRLEDAGPKISFDLQIHRWHTHQLSRTPPPNHPSLPPTSTHTQTHTHKELFVFPLSHVNKYCVCPDHVAVCGLMKLTTEARRRQMAQRKLQRGDERYTACSLFASLCCFSIRHITRHRQ